MSDAALKALLDPEANGRGGQILRTVQGSSVTSHYVIGGSLAPGHAKWIDVNTGDSDAAKNTAIAAEIKRHR